MSYVNNEDCLYIVEYPMFPTNIYCAYQDAQWLLTILHAKYDLAGMDLTGCLDSELL